MATVSKASKPLNWPSEVQYLHSTQSYSAAIPRAVISALHTPTTATSSWPKLPAAALTSPCPLASIRAITHPPHHPANGQNGLFAAAHLPPASFVLLYVGRVHLDAAEDTDPESDYDLALDRELGLAVDAATAGNEARFINDYRGVAEGPNAEFKDCWVQMPAGEGRRWERRMGVFVLGAGKAGKRAKGIAPGQEILVNYGRSFWKERKGGGADGS